MNAGTVLKLLNEAYHAFLAGDQHGYEQYMARARSEIGDSEEERWLLGEWTLLTSMPHICDPAALIRIYDEAAVYMQGKHSSILTAERSIGFSGDSVFWAILRAPGTADAQGELFKQAVQRYHVLTGCGQGYAEFYQAELAYQRGDLAGARVLAYQAAYLAQGTQQKNLTMSSAKLIGYIGAHFRDMRDWAFAVKTVKDLTGGGDECPTSAIARTANIIRSELLLLIHDYDALPEWLREGRFNASIGEGVLGMQCRTEDPHFSYYDFPYVLWTHALYLMHTQQYARALAADAMQRMFRIEDVLPCYQILFGLLRGVCNLSLGERSRAAAEFDAVAAYTVPDGLWLTLGMFAPISDGLILDAVKKNGGDADRVRQIACGFCDNLRLLREAVAMRNVDRVLTARESEVAKLAAQGMRNREIAKTLNVTEQTVKFHLSNIFTKLDIENRSKLAALLKTST